MKNRIFKIMGVSLALVLVFSLGVAFLPANTPAGPEAAEAGDLSWSNIGIPTTVGDNLVGAGEDVGPVAISPDFANDHTVFAAVNVSAATGRAVVAKSTNGGHTWSLTTTLLGTVAGDPIVALVVSPSYASDSTVFVATQDVTNPIAANNGRVYRSTNGGATFTQLGVVTLAAQEMITSMDVSPTYDGVGTLAVGIANIDDNVLTTATREVQLWGSGGVLNWSAFGDAGIVGEDITSVKFSPNYAIDSTLLAVGSDFLNTWLHTRVGSNAWDATIGGPALIETGANGAYEMDVVGADGIRYADIALPSNYNGTIATSRRAYVSLATDNVTAEAAGFMDVYRVTGTSTAANLAITAGVQLANIEFVGDFSGGTLLGARYATAAAVNADVYRTTNPTSAVVNWYSATNRPAGVSAAAGPTGWVVMSPDYANDQTVIIGTDGNESAFGTSTEGGPAYWNETGLIGAGALANLGDMEISPAYATDSAIYLLADWTGNGGTSDTALWRRTNQYGGDYWDMVHWANFAGTAGDGVIALSNEYGTNGVVYFADDATTSIWYSGTSGDAWSARTIAAGIGVTVQTLAAPDATTLYVGDSGSGTVAKSTNSGWTWPGSQSKPSGAATRVASLKAMDSTVLVGGGAGTVRRSDDSASTWSKISSTLTAGNIYVAFDGDTVYATTVVAGTTYRSVDGGGWATIGGNATGSVVGAASMELILAADGTLYKGSSTGGAATADEVYRSIDSTKDEPTPGVYFQVIPGLTAFTGAQVPVALSVAPGSTGNVIAIIEDAVGPSLRMYNDTLSIGGLTPTLVSPATGFTLTTGLNVRFKVELMAKVTTIQVLYDWDEDFANGTAANIVAPAIESASTAMTEGKTNYWMARATAPIRSGWSEVRTLYTQVTTRVVSPTIVYPGGLAGSTTDIPLNPVFNWSAFKYATGYELQLAKDAGMTDFIAEVTGANALGNITSWKCPTTLDYSTTYYWRVRAVIGTAVSYSDWSPVTGFTTLAKPVEPAPPIVIEPAPPAPPAPAPMTPAYIYAIIAIGAVLVIVVIVLIVRTRRTP